MIFLTFSLTYFIISLGYIAHVTQNTRVNCLCYGKISSQQAISSDVLGESKLHIDFQLHGVGGRSPSPIPPHIVQGPAVYSSSPSYLTQLILEDNPLIRKCQVQVGTHKKGIHFISSKNI